ncbi:hypothetical protein GCM10010468_26120 [Actinocorallia longicatena]|uniref:Uncharacterized protein n=1 Tax=Actinocorallia longicatena TaxID=111803 RepID=A0ABP6Q7X5_9ACTN
METPPLERGGPPERAEKPARRGGKLKLKVKLMHGDSRGSTPLPATRGGVAQAVEAAVQSQILAPSSASPLIAGSREEGRKAQGCGFNSRQPLHMGL